MTQLKKYHELSNEEKIAKLMATKVEIEEKLTKLYKNFRGVIHEDASSEMKYTTIKVYESQLLSINEELKLLTSQAQKK